jgi:hypothetical protein
MHLVRPPAALLSVAVATSLALANPASAQVLKNKLAPHVGGLFDDFGASIDWQPGEVFVAVPGYDSLVTNSGAIFVYGEVGDDWVAQQILETPQPMSGSGLGASTLEVWGDWLVATEPFADDLKGATQVWRREAGIWSHHQTLIPQDVSQASQPPFFGYSADIEGSTLVVGSPSDQTAGVQSAGAVYVFELQGTSWIQVQKLFPAAPDLQFQGSFGRFVVLQGDTLVVGAPWVDNGVPESRQGAAFVFERSGGTWTQVQKLVPDDLHEWDLVGQSLALEGDTLFVGAAQHDHGGTGVDTGVVYVFTRSGGLWTQTQEILPEGDPYPFGRRMDLEGNLAVISSMGDSDLGWQSGSAYGYRRTDTQWERFGKALAPEGSLEDWFGFAVRVRDTRILVSAPQAWSGAPGVGEAFVFDIAPRTWQYGSCLLLAPCGNSDDHGGCLNSTGQGAVLAAGGTTSVSADALRLEARWLPANVLGILFMGDAQAQLPFGDGRLVVGSGASGLYRVLPPQSSGTQGALAWDGGLVANSHAANPPAGQIQAGDTWYYQAWYRDPTGPCGSGFNVSNGLQVEFKP